MTIFAHPRKGNPKQKELTQVDEARESDEGMDDDVFNHNERLSNLEEGRFATKTDTIFSAILQELKNRKSKR
jgi:hypothetical protein